MMDARQVASARRFVTVDGTVWPVDWHDEDNDSVQWKLRYAPRRLTDADFMFAASVMAAYASLTDHHRTMSEAERMLHRARTAARECPKDTDLDRRVRVLLDSVEARSVPSPREPSDRNGRWVGA